MQRLTAHKPVNNFVLSSEFPRRDYFVQLLNIPGIVDGFWIAPSGKRNNCRAAFVFSGTVASKPTNVVPGFGASYSCVGLVDQVFIVIPAGSATFKNSLFPLFVNSAIFWPVIFTLAAVSVVQRITVSFARVSTSSRTVTYCVGEGCGGIPEELVEFLGSKFGDAATLVSLRPPDAG
jgi:hypothetical protein